MKHAEQIEHLGCCQANPRRRRYLKRKMARAERQEGKRLLDDAPKRRQYKGWEY